MRVVIAPDSFGGTLTAQQAADAIARGWRRAAPADDLDLVPLADGGPGFVAALHAGLGGELLAVTASSPLGEAVPATVLLVPGPAGRTTAYVESAQAVGLALVPPDRRDPTRTTTRGAGELVRAAVEAGAARVVVGLGGSATNDAGAGMLAALGAGDPEVLGAGGGGLGAVTADDLAGLADLRAELSGIDLVAAYDVDVPLLGLHGASAGFSPQKGATPQQAQDLERALGHFAHVATLALGPGAVRVDLLADARSASASARLAGTPGAGAAGGLGFGLALLGARLVSGAGLVADAVRLAERVAAADVVVTGEGTFDWQSLHGKVVSEVAARGLPSGVPTVVVAGQVGVGRREWSAAGFAAAYAVATTADEVARSMSEPAGTLADRAERVARTWSR